MCFVFFRLHEHGIYILFFDLYVDAFVILGDMKGNRFYFGHFERAGGAFEFVLFSFVIVHVGGLFGSREICTELPLRLRTCHLFLSLFRRRRHRNLVLSVVERNAFIRRR